MLTLSSYYLCEKTDGMRYLLYLTADEQGDEIQYLIDRKNDFWFIPRGTLHLPLLNDVQRFHTFTLLDGELVLDREKDGSTQPRFMIFDCMVLDKQPLIGRTLDKRLAYCKEHLMKPYEKLLTDFPQEIPHQHFLLQMKAFQFSYHIEMMFKQTLPNLSHGNDGLIFTARQTPYQHGTDHHILKWKPEDENSIDFLMRLEWPMIQPDEQDIAEGIREPFPDYDGMPICNLYVFQGGGQSDKWFGVMNIEADKWEGLKRLGQPLDNRIVECYMDENKQWKYMRFRDDKTTGNHQTTVDSVIESIRDRVTMRDLIQAAPAIKTKWKQREADSLSKQAEKTLAARPSPNQANGTMKRKAEDQGNGRPSPAPPGGVKNERA